MPPPSKKRKTAKSTAAARKKAAAAVAENAQEAAPPPADEEMPAQQAVATVKAPEHEEALEQVEVPEREAASEPAETPAAEPTEEDAAAKAQDRMARFRALQQRAKASSNQNVKAANAEAQRLAADPSQLTSLRRKRDVAAHKLLKAETEEDGGDFERKRAWDWTVDESEAWDRRVAHKAANRDNNAFQDYRREAEKVYDRQLQNLNPDLEQYVRDKWDVIEKAAAKGTLEIVETEDGELVALDKNGLFVSTADSTSFADNKPSKQAIDRLVNDQRKADDAAAKKRRERIARNGDDADVTYINEKNKQFNQKLSRFYNKYTAEIRDSFERGTMI